MESQKIENYAKQLVNAFYQVHKELGPGMLESVYLFCIMIELKLKGINAEQEVLLPLYYRGNKLNKGFRIDILVENEIIIEIKSIENLLPVPTAQLISYLKLSNKKIGFLININVPIFKEGIHRFVYNY